jgi:carboxyl-terminal processing protease
MENKVGKTIFFVVLSLILLTGTFLGGAWVGSSLTVHSGSSLSITSNSTSGSTEDGTSPSVETTPVDRETLFQPFWQAWDLVHQLYIDQPVDDTLLMQGALSGMMDALGDPHSSYMDPFEFEQANAPLVGEYEGIGAYVDTSTNYLTIVSPIPNTPAEAAGLRSGDQIIAVNGEDMTGVDASVVLRQVLGPAGTDVTLTILRDAMDAPFDVTITRAVIEIPSVISRMLDENIAYIRISSFGATTGQDVEDALSTLLSQNPHGIILDLRYNGGGYVNSAVDVISQFVGSGVALYEEYGDGTRQATNINPGGLATGDIPLVVLINEGSASASEITAGAIQDYGRGVLIGVTSYGKGSVQQWIPLDNDQGAVRITIAHWLTPNGNMINGIGLTPDIVVEITDADIESGTDSQLNRAIEYILNGE